MFAAGPGNAEPPKADPIHWQMTADIAHVGKVDCTTLPSLDYVLLRFHQDGGYIHNYETPPSTTIYIAEATEWDTARDTRVATGEACQAIFEGLRARPQNLPGIELSLLHPFGGPTDGYGDRPKFRSIANTNYSIARRYLPKSFVQRWQREFGAIKAFVYFGDALSDDIVLIGNDYYYESTFSEGIPITNPLTCRGKISSEGRFSMPLKDIYCVSDHVEP